MKELFNDMKAKRAEKIKKADEEQQLRKEKLEHVQNKIDELQNAKGVHIPHPIQKHKLKKEQKNLQNDIEAYETSKSTSKFILIGLAVLTALFLTIFFLDNLEEDKSNDFGKKDQMEIVDQSQRENQQTIPEDTGESTDKNGEEDVGCAKITIDDVDMTVSGGYAHLESDSIILGNDEEVTFTLTVNNPKVTIDDLVIYYDELILDVNIEKKDDGNNKTKFSAIVTGIAAGSSDFQVATVYDLIHNEPEQVEVKGVNVHKLDAEDGRVVYVTPSGNKYHNSKSCAGDNAMATTYYDAMNAGIKPCGNCG